MADRHFVVVGGTRGIGLALVRHLIGLDGHAVSVLGRTPIQDLHAAALTQYAVDISRRDALVSALDQAVAERGKVSSVVFLQRHRGQGDDFEAALALTLGATRHTIDHLVNGQAFSDEGHANSIVLVSSIADRFVAPEQSLSYHLGKAGFSQLARYYALELGPIGIRVNSVSPCVVAKDEAKAFYDANEWLVNRYKKFIPLGRMGTPSDIVNAVMFLTSDLASYITGQNIVVDGGLTIRSHESMLRDLPRESQS